jgi:hypothetical protein
MRALGGFGAVLFLAFLGSCVGEVPAPVSGDGGMRGGDGTGLGQQVNAVFSLNRNGGACNSPACHGGVQPPNLTSTDALRQTGAARYLVKPGATSLIATRGPHQTTQYFTADERALVEDWVDGL